MPRPPEPIRPSTGPRRGASAPARSQADAPVHERGAGHAQDQPGRRRPRPGASAPCTVGSFTYLARKDFFDATSCHRLTTGAPKVLQCGDPTGTGAGGPAYQYDEENLPKADPGKETATYHKGTLAMANAGPGTNASQFFMVYGDSELPPNYTVFGRITIGMDILEQVARAGADNTNGEGDGAPKKKITIQDVTIAALAATTAR
ncbi:peptidylprolyl isomerase [Streptomyces lavendulae]|uniref:peptidylprolyl isomerase n=1 Tax=Streptomyces lavendulae TaxID=1914 RepID=UPI00332DFB9E